MDGSTGKPWSLFQKRICFTELAANELVQHAEVFGEFALEFEIATLRRMGAIPVSITPLFPSVGALDGISAAMLARLGEVQEVLTRLEGLKRSIANHHDAETISITRNGQIVKPIRCTVGGAKDLLSMMETEIQPIESLVASIRGLCGYFYPVENLSYTDELAYYRQREWRVVGNMVHYGLAITEAPTDEDIQALLDIDNSFFGREIEFPTGVQTMARQTQFYRSFLQRPIHLAISRVIVPEKALAQARSLFEERGIDLKLIALEGLSAQQA